VWHKKIEKSLMSGVDAKELGLKAERRRHEERLKEIEKVKQQREQRERERVEKEEEREIMAREEALIEAVELEKKEEEFHLQQAKMRSDIRVKEGRARAIDLVSRNIHAEPGAPEFDFGVHPLEIFDGLTVSEMDELIDDLRNYAHLDREDARRRFFWSNMIAVADAELSEARRREDIDRARVRGVDTRDLIDHGLHASLDGDVRDMLEGKSFAELEELEGEIEASLRAPDASESEYWTAVLRRVVTHKARVAVADATMEMRRVQSEARPREVPPPPPPSGAAGGEDSDDEDLLGADFGRAAAEPGAPGDVSEDDEAARASPRAMSPEPMSPGGFTPEGTPDRCYSPEPFPPGDAGDLEVVDEAEDRARLQALRAAERSKKLGRFAAASAVPGSGAAGRMAERATFEGFKASSAAAAEGAAGALRPPPGEEPEADEDTRRSRALAEKMMGDSGGAEVAFAGEAPLESQVYWWHDKYRPRKPKYFNRVHTGYDWNKYNQTHYDHDNPPPKTVQGYKFNIFFPDLIDKTKAPTYTIIPDGSKHGETCILRIHAGPPYEDIAFKIVNKEWEYSNKRGFRCSFERGIFHLYINFKRARYRR
jgi:hypothetical protein